MMRLWINKWMNTPRYLVARAANSGRKLTQPTRFLSLKQDLKMFLRGVEKKNCRWDKKESWGGHFESRHTSRMSWLWVKQREHHRQHQHVYAAHKRIILRARDNGLACARWLPQANESSHLFLTIPGAPCSKCLFGVNLRWICVLLIMILAKAAFASQDYTEVHIPSIELICLHM